jgi:hypothetical protein
MKNRKPAKKKSGPKAEGVKTDVPWERGVKDALAKTRPPTGWRNEHKKKR